MRACEFCSLFSKRLESTWTVSVIRQIALDESSPNPYRQTCQKILRLVEIILRFCLVSTNDTVFNHWKLPKATPASVECTFYRTHYSFYLLNKIEKKCIPREEYWLPSRKESKRGLNWDNEPFTGPLTLYIEHITLNFELTYYFVIALQMKLQKKI